MDATPAEPDIVPARKLAARVDGLYAAVGKGFETTARDHLDLTFDGIGGDVHHGPTRRSGGREPWYPRGTEIRNERQVTIVAADELAIAAGRMAIAEIRPEWIGANIVLSGLRRLSLVPAGTLLFLEGGATLKVDAQNHPCGLAGRAIAKHQNFEDIREASLLFPKHAKGLRGLTAWVEKPGRISLGEKVTARIPQQWIYKA